MEYDAVKKQLLAEKAELEARLERTHKHIYLKDGPVSANFNEQVKQTENDELVRTLEAEGLGEIVQINTALRRLEDHVYTQCSKCAGAIAEDRLRAIPYTDLCIACATKSAGA